MQQGACSSFRRKLPLHSSRFTAAASGGGDIAARLPSTTALVRRHQLRTRSIHYDSFEFTNRLLLLQSSEQTQTT